MKFCPALPGSRQSYKLFINHILQLRVKRFIPASRDPCFVLPGSRFAGTKFSHVIPSACLSGIKKLIKKHLWKYISIDRRYFYYAFTTHMTSICEKKFNKHFCRISPFYRGSHRRCSARKLFLKILRYSQENICVGVSFWAFKSAVLSKRDSNVDVFLRNF